VRRAVAAFAAALALAGAACRKAEPAPPTPPAGEVWLTEEQIRGGRLVIEPLATRRLTLHLVTAGRAAFDEGRVAHVFSPVSGRITRVLGTLGRKVRAGEPLAVIESPDLATAWSDLLKARADRVAAGHEDERQKNLFEHGAGSERDAEAARDNAAKAAAELERAELRLKLLHASADGPATQQFLLRAPVDGEIVNRTATPGLEVQGMLSSANIVQELFTIGELDPIWIWGDVYERDLDRVRPGQKVAITSVAYPGRAIGGTLNYVAAALDPQTHTARIRCVVPNAGRLLKPEMYVTLAVELEGRDAPALPRSAVIRAGERQTVFLEDGKAPDGRRRFLQRPVELEEADDGWVGIASGVKPGERVVVSGSILLSGGSD
jgi:cobalt-zinc-cadmium efflux system membrane fusion protein